MNARKVVHVAESFGSGTFEVIRQLANHQADDGWHVTILHGVRPETPDDKALAGLLDPRIERTVLPLKSQINPISDLLSLIRLLNCLRALAPDVIHLHSSKAGLLGRLAARLLCRHSRVLYTPHGWSFMRQDVSWLHIRLFVWLERLGNWLGGTILACSTSEEQLARRVLGAQRVKLLRNGIALPEAAADSIGDGRHRVVTVGRLTVQKAPWRITALARLPDMADVRFLWIGGGSIEERQRWLDGSPVELTGLLSRTEVAALLSHSDVFLLLSEWEGLPLALVEAQAMGIPAIVSNIAGCTEVVEHGCNGFVANNGDEAARYLRRLLDDAELRARMGSQAAERMRNLFSPEQFLRQADQIYADTLKALP